MKQKKLQFKNEIGGWYGGCALWILLVLVFWLFSCGKEQVLPVNNYSMIIDRYSLDTLTRYDSERYFQDLGALTIQEGYKLDTAKTFWYIDCNLPDRLQELYYLKNGKRIQQK